MVNGKPWSWHTYGSVMGYEDQGERPSWSKMLKSYQIPVESHWKSMLIYLGSPSTNKIEARWPFDCELNLIKSNFWFDMSIKPQSKPMKSHRVPMLPHFHPPPSSVLWSRLLPVDAPRRTKHRSPGLGSKKSGVKATKLMICAGKFKHIPVVSASFLWLQISMLLLWNIDGVGWLTDLQLVFRAIVDDCQILHQAG